MTRGISLSAATSPPSQVYSRGQCAVQCTLAVTIDGRTPRLPPSPPCVPFVPSPLPPPQAMTSAAAPVTTEQLQAFANQLANMAANPSGGMNM